MPVSNTQRGQADGAIRSIHAGVGSERVYRQVMAVRPKGFRASILKLIDWPTSWGVLYDLSPAQISQNREAEAARETWEATGTSYAGGANKARMWMGLLGSYFLGQPEPMSESNFPSWRKPSWMTDEEQRRIKEFIRASYEADAPLETTMPVEDVPREQRMADLAQREEQAMEVTVPQQQADDGEGSEPFENEGVQESGQAQENAFESLYILYQAYWRRVFLIRDAEDLRDRINPASANYRVTVKNSAVAIYALEKLGYEYTGIKNLLQAMANRGLGVAGIRPGNRNGFNAYLLLDLKAERGSATKYRSGVAYNIMAETCRTSVSTLKGQFERSDRRNLQVFKFSGSGPRLVGVQVISLNYLNGGSNADTFQEGNRKVRVARDEARAQVAENTGATTPATASAPSASSGTDQYSFMGFQTFREGQTFISEGQLFRTGNLNGQRQSTVFYFAKRNADGTYTLYRSVFGVAELNVLRFNGTTTMGIEGLKRAWNESGKLNETDKIAIQRVPVLDLPKLKRAYRALGENQIASRAFKPVRSQEATLSVPFGSIVRMTLEVNNALLESFPVEAEPQPAEAMPSAATDQVLSQDYMKRLGASGTVANNAFGIEIEGYFTNKTKDDVAREMSSDGIKVKSTGYHGSAPSGYFKLESDVSVLADGQGRSPLAFEMVSPVLKGQQGKDKLLQMLTELRKYGAKTTASAGTHIHFPFEVFGGGEQGLQKRKQLITNVLVLAPFLKATQVLYSQDRYYARDWTNVNAQNLRELQTKTSWEDVVRFVQQRFEAGRNFLHIKESSRMGSSYGPPTYEFRFPASNFEDDSVYNLVRLLDRIWTVSTEGYVPHSPAMCEPRRAEAWLTDLLGVELYAFWRNRIRDVYPTHRYLKSRGDAEYDSFSNDQNGGNWVSEISDSSQTPTAPRTPVPPLNDW